MAKNFLDSLGAYLPGKIKAQASALSMMLLGVAMFRLGTILEAARIDQPSGLPAFLSTVRELYAGNDPEALPLAPVVDFTIGDFQAAGAATTGIKSILQDLTAAAATQSYTSATDFDTWKVGTRYENLTLETAPLIAVAQFIAQEVTPGAR